MVSFLPLAASPSVTPVPAGRRAPHRRAAGWGARLAAVLLTVALGACAQGKVSAPPAEEQAGAPAPSAAPPVVSAPAVPVPPPDSSVEVGLLLPLSGSNAALGQALLNAAEMAMFDQGDERFTLVVRDAAMPGGAAQAAQQLTQEGVRIVLGPIFASTVGQAAPVVRGAGVPMVSFSTDVSVAGGGVYVMGVLPGLQVERVVGYAAAAGHRRIAALVPSSPFGQTVAVALQRSAPNVNATVAQLAYYDPTTPDLSGAVQGLNPGGTPSFDALLIPEGAPRLQAIAPLVQFYDIDTTQVRLLGTALWDDPALAAEPALLGGWFAAPQPEQWRAFAERYRRLYGSEPPRIASLAYDATALAAVLARQGGTGFTREALLNPNGFSGIDGVFRFSPDGRVERGLAVFEMRPEGPVVVDPAPQSFEPRVF